MYVPQACLEFVLGLANVMYDPKYVVAAGVSNGGAIVAPLASRYSIYTHAMIFHARQAFYPEPYTPSLKEMLSILALYM